MPCENKPIQVIVVSISGYKPSNLSVYRVEAVQCIYSYSSLSLCVVMVVYVYMSEHLLLELVVFIMSIFSTTRCALQTFFHQKVEKLVGHAIIGSTRIKHLKVVVSCRI